jgi:hypothetical protein
MLYKEVICYNDSIKGDGIEFYKNCILLKLSWYKFKLDCKLIIYAETLSK